MTDIDERVRGYVHAAMGGGPPDRTMAVTPLDSGERHAVFKVSYRDPAEGTHAVVVRISLSNDGGERAQASREAAVLRKVQGVAAPLLHDFRLDSAWFDTPAMCLQFVPGRHGTLRGTCPADIERLGALVGRLHGLPADELRAWFPDAEPAASYRDGRIEQVAGYLPSVRDPLPPSLQRRLRRASLLVSESLDATRSARSFTDHRLVLLHGDVATGNVIWDPKPVLIDWEYARIGDPADEIAYIFSQNGLDGPQREAFWRGYRARILPDGHFDDFDDLVDRVRWWEPVTLLGSALWWVERWSRRADADAAGTVDRSAPRTQRHYLDNARRRIDRLDEMLSPGPRATRVRTGKSGGLEEEDD